MLSLQECLENIKNAVFGRDVRQSIHDGIDTINKESKADMAAKQKTIDTYTAKQDALDQKYDRLLDEMSQANPSLAEVVDARHDESGTVFTNLRERLNNSDKQQANNVEKLREELIDKKNDSDTKIAANQTVISINQTNISATNTSLTALRNDVNSYKTTTNNRLTSLEADTGWQNIPLNPLGFKGYSGGGLKYRAIGKIINIRGVLTTTSNITLADGEEVPLTMFALHSSVVPKETVVTLHQGSGKAIFITLVKTDGTIAIGRYRVGDAYPSTIPSNVWLPINIMYIAK